MIELEKCPNCNGTGLVQIAPNVKGLKRCLRCDGKGKIPVSYAECPNCGKDMQKQEEEREMSFLTRLFKCKRKLYAFEPDYVVRPSETILETMEAHGVTIHDLWKRTGLTMIAIVLADKELINMDVATELSKALGSEPEFWLNLSKNYHDKKGDKDV